MCNLTLLIKIIIKYHLFSHQHSWSDRIDNLKIVEFIYDREMKLKQMENLSTQFNVNQHWVFDAIMFVIKIDFEIAHFFLQSSIEMSKIFLYKTFCSYYHERDHIVFCVTFFNIATLLLLDEITSYFHFKILLKINNRFKCAFVFQSDIAQLLRKTFLII